RRTRDVPVRTGHRHTARCVRSCAARIAAAGTRIGTRAVRHWVLLAITTSPLLAHVVSMSTGEVHVDGTRVTYELRIPSYEAAHVAKPETALLDAVTFRSGRETTAPVQRSCREEA